MYLSSLGRWTVVERDVSGSIKDKRHSSKKAGPQARKHKLHPRRTLSRPVRSKIRSNHCWCLRNLINRQPPTYSKCIYIFKNTASIVVKTTNSNFDFCPQFQQHLQKCKCWKLLMTTIWCFVRFERFEFSNCLLTFCWISLGTPYLPIYMYIGCMFF